MDQIDCCYLTTLGRSGPFWKNQLGIQAPIQLKMSEIAKRNWIFNGLRHLAILGQLIGRNPYEDEQSSLCHILGLIYWRFSKQLRAILPDEPGTTRFLTNPPVRKTRYNTSMHYIRMKARALRTGHWPLNQVAGEVSRKCTRRLAMAPKLLGM
jgi:hypothetical protein